MEFSASWFASCKEDAIASNEEIQVDSVAFQTNQAHFYIHCDGSSYDWWFLSFIFTVE